MSRDLMSMSCDLMIMSCDLLKKSKASKFHYTISRFVQALMKMNSCDNHVL